MLDVYTVSFFGHRYIDNFRLAEEKVEKLIYKLFQELHQKDFPRLHRHTVHTVVYRYGRRFSVIGCKNAVYESSVDAVPKY